jgi:exodeoxyribonuclease VIII
MNAISPARLGIIDGLDPDAYHSGPGVSKSNLDLIHNAPALLEWSRNAPKDTDCKAAVDLGTAFHSLLLEPDTFAGLYIVDWTPPADAIVTVDDLKAALDGRGIAYKASAGKSALTTLLLDNDPAAPVSDVLQREWAKGLAGRKVLSPAEWKKLVLMRDSAMAHPVARKLLEAPGAVERSYYWHDEQTGELCRARHDKSIPTLGMTLDVKTTADIGKFARSIHDYRYHVQDAFYGDGHQAVTGEALRGFPFLVVSTTRDRSRYPVRLFVLDQQSRDVGRAEYRADLARYAAAKKSGLWPGLETISLPGWYLAQSIV